MVTVEGGFDAKAAFEMVSRARELSAARGWNILYDMKAAVPGDMSHGQLFWMPRKLPALREPSAAKFRVAVVHASPHAALAEFWESAFRNAGLQARAFEDESAAIDWLRS
ncbi:MAG: STAS/SEC14 domain-containing protein [Usitatibacter sp.]